jgi:hypothetical protein
MAKMPLDVLAEEVQSHNEMTKNSIHFAREVALFKRSIYAIIILGLIMLGSGFFIDVAIDVVGDGVVEDNILIESYHLTLNAGIGVLFSSILILGYFTKMLRNLREAEEKE